MATQGIAMPLWPVGNGGLERALRAYWVWKAAEAHGMEINSSPELDFEILVGQRRFTVDITSADEHFGKLRVIASVLLERGDDFLLTHVDEAQLPSANAHSIYLIVCFVETADGWRGVPEVRLFGEFPTEESRKEHQRIIQKLLDASMSFLQP